MSKVHIVGIGVRTPVGHCYRSAGAAVRCGICAYAEHPYMIDQHGEPMVVAMDSTMAPEMLADDRCIAMLTDSIVDAIEHAGMTEHLSGKSIAMYLSLGHQLEQDKIFAAVNKQLQTKLSISLRVKVYKEGHAGGLLALKHAADQLRRDDSRMVLVAGVDSHMLPQHLEAIESDGQLHSINNSWGFTPGEGAGVILLAGQRLTEESRLSPLAAVRNVQTAHEPNLLGTKTVCIGEGLTESFADLIAPPEKIYDTWCDLNGQTYRAEEYGFSICRVGQQFEDASVFVAPAECWGDVGAASPLLGIALAAAAWKGGYSRGPNSVVWSSSATAKLRGATLIESSSLAGVVT